MPDLDYLDDDIAEAAASYPWADAPIGAPTVMAATCARHGRYPAGEWCARCEQAEEIRLNREYDRQMVLIGGDRS